MEIASEVCMKFWVYSGCTLMAQWLSWLERRPVTAEVTGSSPVWVDHGCMINSNIDQVANMGS